MDEHILFIRNTHRILDSNHLVNIRSCDWGHATHTILFTLLLVMCCVSSSHDCTMMQDTVAM